MEKRDPRDPRDGFDQLLTLSDMEEVRIDGEMRELPVPLEAQHIVDSDGVCDLGVDTANETTCATFNGSREELEIFEGALNDKIAERFEDLVLNGEVLYRTPFVVFLELNAGTWEDVFGSPPDEIGSWEPLWKLTANRLVVSYDMDIGDTHVDTVPPIAKYNRHGSNPTALDTRILPIRVDPATELEKLGLLSRPQAQAYMLQDHGYTTKEIAALIGKKKGTTSSHRHRALEKMKKYRHAANLSEYHGETHSYNWEVLSERFGETYQPEGAMRVRILGGEVSDSGEALYLIQHEDGTLGYKAVDNVDDWESIDVDDDVFPAVPDRAKENGFGVID